MSLLAKISADQLQARKNKDADKTGLLTSLISEASIIGKNADNRETTDSETLSVIKKFIDNAKLTIDGLKAANRDSSKQESEVNILKEYIPEQMTKGALEALLNAYHAANPDAKMKDAMSHLSGNYTGQYDGKTAAILCKALFPMK